MSDENCKYVSFGICGIMCILTVVMIIVLGGAGTVEPVEYGIIYNKFSKSINLDEGVKTGGWYFIGWTNNFITFPATQVNMDFTTFRGSRNRPIKVYDLTGQAITVSFALQYKLDKTKIIDLYNKYQTTYQRKYESFIKQAITDKVGKFGNTVFWTDRKRAGAELKEAVGLALGKQFAEVIGFQILSIDLLRDRENTLVKTQIINQSRFTSAKIKESKEIRAVIDVTRANAQQVITEIRGKADAAAKTVVGSARAKAATTVLSATSDAYAQLQSKVKVGPDTGLDEFIYYSQLQNTEDTDFLFNIKNAFIKVNQ